MTPRPPALLATDLDGTLVGDPVALALLNAELAARRDRLRLVYVTGRSLPSTLALIETEGLLLPDVIVADVGSHVYDGPDWTIDVRWHQRMSRNWSPSRVRAVASFFPELTRQPPDCQTAFKCSYFLNAAVAPWVLPALDDALRWHRVNARVIYSSGRDLDFVPAGSGKGNAVRHVASRLGVPMSDVVTCGDSGNDREMLALGCPAAVVANHQPELLPMPGAIYRARGAYAAGVREALMHYGHL